MPEEVGGTLSTFGEQVLSTKQTNPKHGFGTSGRTEKPYDKAWELRLLGRTSPGANYAVPSGFGNQTLQANQTAPAYRFGGRQHSDVNLAKEARPGPGTYETYQGVGKQLLSPKKNAPTWRVGTGPRFGQYSPQIKDEYATPGPGDWKPPAGYLGDAPQYTFHGTAKRYDTRDKLPGQKPTPVENPGPGEYEPPSSFGAQHDARKLTTPRPKIGTANRTEYLKQFISNGHERVLLGQHSPAPSVYRNTPSVGPQVSSRRPNANNFKFGSSDRFSDVKPVRGGTLPFNNPGPGSYVV